MLRTLSLTRLVRWNHCCDEADENVCGARCSRNSHGGASTQGRGRTSVQETDGSMQDQRGGTKKCGHLGGKVLVSMQEHIDRLIAARLQVKATKVEIENTRATDTQNRRTCSNTIWSSWRVRTQRVRDSLTTTMTHAIIPLSLVRSVTDIFVAHADSRMKAN